ncbi:hypothetical protein EQ826_19815 [Ectopseudomonas mendocina]|nr:hypothetical protein [Pseudomonas mendocina]TRO15860.1 hypothetical protein EQ828_20155 [Pseudomonas mendocina]TRO23044.1 hypothetical protein EQ826_19815 [Pseudomonas mendocina]
MWDKLYCLAYTKGDVLYIAKFVRVLWFLSVFSGAFGFSLAILVSRVLYDNAGLHGLLALQVNTSFMAFLIQFGLRAGLRKEYLVGNYRIVDLVESALLRKWPIFLVPASVFFLLAFSGSVLIAIYFANALLTLLVGLRLVQQKVSAAAGYSLLVFLINFSSGLVFVLLDEFSVELKGFLIEFFSMFVCFLASLMSLPGKRRSRNSLVLMKAVFLKYLGLQVSSFVIIFSSYVYAQTILYFSADDVGLIVIFSDAVLVSGVVSMVLSRVLLLFEKNIVRSRKVAFYMFASHFFIFMFCLIYAFVYEFIGGGGIVMPFLVMLFLMGKIAIAQVSSFLNENCRRTFTVSLLVLVCMQLVVYSDRYVDFGVEDLEVYASLCNIFVLSAMLVLFYGSRKGSYISERSVLE